MGYLYGESKAPNEVKMNEETLEKEEENLEPAPYQGAYRKELDDPDPEPNPAEEEIPEAATSKEESNSFVEQTTKSEQPEHDYKKRYDDLKKHYDAKIEEHKSKEEELLDLAKQASGGGVKYIPPKTPEELEQFKEQYPDVYNVIETVAHSQAENKTKALQDEIKDLQGDRQRLTKEKAEQELLRLHPDFMNIKADEDFIGDNLDEYNIPKTVNLNGYFINLSKFRDKVLRSRDNFSANSISPIFFADKALIIVLTH